MEKIIEGHLLGFESVRDMQQLEDDYYGEFTDVELQKFGEVVIMMRRVRVSIMFVRSYLG